MAVSQGKRAVSKWQIASSKTNGKTPTKKSLLSQRRNSRRSGRFERRGRQLFRFREAVGKTVEFVEMGTNAEFPCVEISFTDKTALLFLIEPRLTIEPSYSDWTTGNQRPLLEWPVQETS